MKSTSFKKRVKVLICDDNHEHVQGISELIKIEGDYISTLNFLREIIDGERFATIENVTLESHENILKGDIEILIFSVAAPS